MTTRIVLVVALLASLTSAVSSQENTWTLANDQVEATFRLTSAGLLLQQVVDPETGRSLGLAGGPDSTATINGATSALGSSAGGWVLQEVSGTDTETGAQLAFTFRSQRAPLVAVRTYACYRGSPAIETWTTFRATGSTPVTVSNLNLWQMTVPSSVVHYEFGLRGDAAGLQVDEAFSLQTARLEEGDELGLDEANRSSEQFVPIIGADLEQDEFFGGVMWSGSWQILAQKLAGGLARVTAGIPRVSIRVDADHPLETPHGFFGFTPGGRGDISAALHQFVMQGVRGGRPFQALVTDNTWFSYGTELDQASMMEEIAGAASVGVELFVVDAGWYLGVGRDGDFEPGLGSWETDRRRFPDGLGALREYAHALGMQFGIWVEPERVALTTVGRPGLAEQAWLASDGGSFGSPTARQICLASPSARQWVVDRLTDLIDEVQPDYLKWDNNMWVNCTRTGHVHGATDGNFSHVKGLYDVLATLRERYPALQIENCSQGGNRLDFGMLRYTDTAWMDDRTSPAAHVRHNLEGLMTWFPPAYLLSFVLNDNEPIVESPDLGLFLRSRMPGILGLTYRSHHLTESDRDRLAAEIRLSKTLREISRNASGTLLTEQAAPENGPAWDGLQHLDTSSGTVILFAFQNDRAVPDVVLQPRRLAPDTVYLVTTPDGEVLASATGARLMEGVPIEESSESSARILILRPAAGENPARRRIQ
jgi:alpha-galactosidase